MSSPENQPRVRLWITQGFSTIEDIVYIGLGILLASGAIALLISAAVSLTRSVTAGTLHTDVIDLLDRILLILLVVELLYTVQVSFREHALLPEPFLLVGLIAAVRRVLVITAEVGHLGAQAKPVTQYIIMELGVLTVLIVALAISLYALRGREGSSVVHRG